MPAAPGAPRGLADVLFRVGRAYGPREGRFPGRFASLGPGSREVQVLDPDGLLVQRP
jgi:hypothetical protein